MVKSILRIFPIALTFSGITFATPPSFLPYSKASESDVRNLIFIGMSKNEIVEKYGLPTVVVVGKNKSELWQYIVDPHIARQNFSHYYGFEVSLEGERIKALEFIR